MFNLKTLALACAVAFATPAFAQFTTGGSSSSSAGDYEGYNFIGLSYDNTTLSPKYGNDMGMNGFAISYLRGISISQAHPMFLEVGAKFTAGFHSESVEEFDDEYSDISSTLMSLSVPVNYAWRFAINDNFSIKPYLGINFKFNMVGQSKRSFDGDSETTNWFDKEDMEDPFKRFQLGWHVGAAFQYTKFSLGLSYGTDFIEIAKKTSTGTFDLTLGYTF